MSEVWASSANDSNRLVLSYSSLYTGALSEEVRFPRMRYVLVYEELRRRGVDVEFREPKPVSREDLLRCHDASYVDRFLNGLLTVKEERAIGLRPWTEDMIPRTLRITGGTLDATLRVLDGARASGNLGGGTHHSFRDRGAGYCVFNDIGVAARVAQHRGVERILVIDLDVHQGDGTAALFAGEENVFTFSMHGERNFPFRKQESTLDIPLEDHLGDREYLAILDHALPRILQGFLPDLVFFQSGVDALQSDKLGRLGLTREGIQERNRLVFGLLSEQNCPTVVTMGGGYASPIEDSVASHADTFEEMVRAFQTEDSRALEG